MNPIERIYPELVRMLKSWLPKVCDDSHPILNYEDLLSEGICQAVKIAGPLANLPDEDLRRFCVVAAKNHVRDICRAARSKRRSAPTIELDESVTRDPLIVLQRLIYIAELRALLTDIDKRILDVLLEEDADALEYIDANARHVAEQRSKGRKVRHRVSRRMLASSIGICQARFTMGVQTIRSLLAA